MKDVDDAKNLWEAEYEKLHREKLKTMEKEHELDHQLELEKKIREHIEQEQTELEKLTHSESSNVTTQQVKHNVTQEEKLIEAVQRQKENTEHDLERSREQLAQDTLKETEASKKFKEEVDHVKEELPVVQTTIAPFNKNLPSLYCYSLMLPFGYEPGLLKAQLDKKMGIFSCNEFAVFSNSTIILDTGDHVASALDIKLLDFSLAVQFGGKWHTAMNRDIFNKVWTEIVHLGVYKNHDWVVKVDPDSVFFPDRLQHLLMARQELSDIAKSRQLQEEHTSGLECNLCKLEGFTQQTCNSHVQYMQTQGHSCSEAIRRVKRAPPVDCGCNCNRYEACDIKLDPDMYTDFKVVQGFAQPGAIYINNCKFGLHGPIEVVSQQAVTAFVNGLPKCNNLLGHAWGEDKFLDRCMLELGITRVNQFALLNEIACGEEPAPCGGGDVAYHPFKSFSSYSACWEYATEYGHPYRVDRNSTLHV